MKRVTIIYTDQRGEHRIEVAPNFVSDVKRSLQSMNYEVK